MAKAEREIDGCVYYLYEQMTHCNWVWHDHFIMWVFFRKRGYWSIISLLIWIIWKVV